MDVFIYQMGLLTFMCSLQIGGKKSSKLVSMMVQEGPCSLWGKKGRWVKMTWIFSGPEKFSQNGDPLAQAYWDSSHKHDSLIVFAVNVTLDEATAHPSLLLTEEGRGVTFQETQQDLPSSTQRFVSVPCVLGQPQICAGRYYWEVEVGDLHSWDLGVCRDNVSRKGTFQMSPRNGFWAIRLYQEDYWALTISETHLTLREKPLSVGIFLDYEAGDVSFYNMTDESHIFTFSKQTFYGVLRPLFRLWSPGSGPLTIVQVE